MVLRPVHSRCRSHGRTVSHSGTRRARSRRHSRCASCRHVQSISGKIHFRSVRDACLNSSVVVFERKDPCNILIARCRCDGCRVDVVKSELSPDLQHLRVFDRSMEACSHFRTHRRVGCIITASRCTLRTRNCESIDPGPVRLLLW